MFPSIEYLVKLTPSDFVTIAPSFSPNDAAAVYEKSDEIAGLEATFAKPSKPPCNSTCSVRAPSFMRQGRRHHQNDDLVQRASALEGQRARHVGKPAHIVRHRVALVPPAKRGLLQAYLLQLVIDRLVRAIVAKPDRTTVDGWREYTLLLFLYNCGARVSELTGVRWDDLQLAPPRQVRLRGKTARNEQLHVFVNRHGQPLTRDGVAYILGKYTATAMAQERPALAQKRVTPHVMRHSCAVALLQSGTDVAVIRDDLGHASVATTGRYITTNLQMKRDALETFWVHSGIDPIGAKPWKPKPGLLAFLQSL